MALRLWGRLEEAMEEGQARATPAVQRECGPCADGAPATIAMKVWPCPDRNQFPMREAIIGGASATPSDSRLPACS